MTDVLRSIRSDSCLLAVAILAFASPALARFETIRFIDTNPTPSQVAGFELHAGGNADQYSIVIDIGLPPLDGEGAHILALELIDDAVVYVAVSAYDTLGRNSALSNQIVRNWPGETAIDEGIETWLLAPSLACGGIFDSDGDGVPDECDNCVFRANTDQRDFEEGLDDDSSLPGMQHYGDVCDADLDNDGIVAGTDFFLLFRRCFGKSTSESPECLPADFDGDGVVGGRDFFVFFRPAFGKQPGPGYEEEPP